MTLHKTVEIARKFFIGVIIGIAAIFVLMLIFRLGVIIKNIISPPKVEPANHAFGIVPALSFPQNSTNETLTYKLNTVTGALPKFPDRLNIYTINKFQPNLLNLNKAKEKVKKIGFVNESETVLPEISLGDTNYAWIENTGIGRRITFNTITYDFTLRSSFIKSPTVLTAKHLSNENEATNLTVNFLKSIELLPNDIDLTKTKSELFSIQNGTLVPETNLSRAKVIRVDLHQKNIEYDLNTGIPDLAGGFKKIKITIPIMYNNSPYSTMSFWIASGKQSAEVVEANFVHKTVNLADEEKIATYSIKTSDEAFDELKKGKAYIASYKSPKTNIIINNVYLAYYLDETTQEYLMPIIVFEGNDSFLAYVSAVRTEWVK